MSHILRTSTEHITALLADEENYAYCQSRGAHNIKHIPAGMSWSNDVETTLYQRSLTMMCPLGYILWKSASRG